MAVQAGLPSLADSSRPRQRSNLRRVVRKLQFILSIRHCLSESKRNHDAKPEEGRPIQICSPKDNKLLTRSFSRQDLPSEIGSRLQDVEDEVLLSCVKIIDTAKLRHEASYSVLWKFVFQFLIAGQLHMLEQYLDEYIAEYVSYFDGVHSCATGGYHRARERVRDTLSRVRSMFGVGWFFEWPGGRHPLNSTWPWTEVKPALLVLWGVCWMFPMSAHYRPRPVFESRNSGVLDLASVFGQPPMPSDFRFDTGMPQNLPLPSSSTSTQRSANAQPRQFRSSAPDFDCDFEVDFQSSMNSLYAAMFPASNEAAQPVAASTNLYAMEHAGFFDESESDDGQEGDAEQATHIEAAAGNHSNGNAISTASRASLPQDSNSAGYASGHASTPYPQYADVTRVAQPQSRATPLQPHHSPQALSENSGHHDLQHLWPYQQAASGEPLEAFHAQHNPYYPSYQLPGSNNYGKMASTGTQYQSSYPPPPEDINTMQDRAVPYGNMDREYPMQDHYEQPQDQVSPTRYPSPGVQLPDNPYTQQTQQPQQQQEQAPPPPVAEIPELPAETKMETETASPGRSKPVPKPDREVTKDAAGRFYCAFPGCTEEHKDFARKCEWSKHMDKHDRPYKCLAEGCEKLPGFTYSGGLLRHEREVHNKHGGPRKQLNCPHLNCKRYTGKGFSRQENLNEHLRRVHTTDNAASVQPVLAPDETEEDEGQTGGKRKRARSDTDSLREEIKRLREENAELRNTTEQQGLQTADLMRQVQQLQATVHAQQNPRMPAPPAPMI